MFQHRRQFRRWATRVLLVWLFGVATGIAHACMSPAEHHPVSHQAQHASAAGPDGSPGKSACQDFCEKSTVQIPPLKSALEMAHGHAMPPSVVTLVVAVPAFAPDELMLPRRDGGLAPVPITIAFLRLAL